MRTPKKLASSMNAQKVSYIRSGPESARTFWPARSSWCRTGTPSRSHDTQSERHAEYLQPEVEDHAIDRPAGRKTQRLENGEPRRQSDREGWKDDMERDGKGELNSRQEKRRHIHCNSPGLKPTGLIGRDRRDRRHGR